MVSSSHVFSATPSSSRERIPNTFPLLSMGSLPQGTVSPLSVSLSPSHWLQLFMNCSSLHCSQRTQSFRNTLLHHRSLTGSQVLSANLLLHGFLAPQDHRSCQDLAPVPASHRVTAFFQAFLHVLHVAGWDPSQVTDRFLLLYGSPWAAGTQQLHHGLHHKLQGNPCSSAWTITSISFFTDLDVCRVVSFAYFHSSLSLSHSFFPS